MSLWFSTLLHYSLVTTASRQFTDFGSIGSAALKMVAANHNIQLSDEQTKEAMLAFNSLPPHPEVKEALILLKQTGYKMVALTNSSKKGMETQLKNAEIDIYFDKQLSVQSFGKYKPDSDVYHWASKELGVKNNESMMIAAHGWDVAGAIWAGWRAAFINRPGQQLYPLAPETEINEINLLKIAKKLAALKV
ncbi:haloacid dehalogenase type II [Wenyingzhuangia sp. 2_MG-2023]|uniref:haloacid dehalogenase type II n=1 Tax=Wenyingzhuangia sp. 2_MG-2023 TaxID=3062639 RepID=UPI0026E22F49|nr:haloacid dehalogenase type II [Wenyingzhuangia sp. 2_MG-2023]MDO6736708.1 haloacid dehalogenase type II [Wenyingzhuangia sp. 2_MG-2023]